MSLLRSALREPVCMQGLIKIDAKENVLGKDILLFSNPNTIKGTESYYPQGQYDGGVTWRPNISC